MIRRSIEALLLASLILCGCSDDGGNAPADGSSDGGNADLGYQDGMVFPDSGPQDSAADTMASDTTVGDTAVGDTMAADTLGDDAKASLPSWQAGGTLASVNKVILAAWGTSPSSIYAVGEYTGMYHYDGTSWTADTNLAGLYYAIWGTSDSDIWVGGWNTGENFRHWDGSAWSDVPSSLGAGTESIHGIWGTADNNVWAATSAGILHYDGSSWSAPAGAPTGAWYGIHASGTGVYACSTGKVARYDGSTWTTDPLNGFNTITGDAKNKMCGIWASGPNDIWAGGTDNTTDWNATGFHYDGSGWTSFMSGGTNTRGIKAIRGSGPSNVHMVAHYGKANHHNGSAWSYAGDVGDHTYALWVHDDNFAVAIDQDGAVHLWKP